MFLLGFLGVGVELASWERNAMRAVVVGMLLLCGLLLCGLAVFSVNVIDLIDMELIEFCIKWCAELQAWVKNLYTGAQEIVRPSPPVAAALTVSLVLFVFMLLVLLLRAETWRSIKTVARENPDVPIIPRSAVQAAEDEHQDRMVGTRPVQTLRSARPHQLSIAGVETQWQKMRKSEDAKIRETAELICTNQANRALPRTEYRPAVNLTIAEAETGKPSPGENGVSPRAKAVAVVVFSATTTNSIGLELIEIPAGKFTMGSPAGEKGRKGDEEQVAVTLTKPFGLGKTEVTQGQWKQVMGTEPWEGQDDVQADRDCPATFISFFDAVKFCDRLTDLERKAGKLKANEEYRLPTEAEWEYACRAGTTTAFSFGDESKLSSHAWWGGFDSEAAKADKLAAGPGNAAREQYAHKVGMKKPNRWGLYDMHGNVFEWCSDLYVENLSGGTDPVGQGGSNYVVRGGCWGDYPDDCRSADRFSLVPSLRYNGLGFRVARRTYASLNPVTAMRQFVAVTQKHEGVPMSVEVRRELKHVSCDNCRGSGTRSRNLSRQCDNCHGKRWTVQGSGGGAGTRQETLCPKCRGTGALVFVSEEPCTTCESRGYRIQVIEIRQVGFATTCGECNGKGKVHTFSKKCPRCLGDGVDCKRCSNEGVVEGYRTCNVCRGKGEQGENRFISKVVRED